MSGNIQRLRTLERDLNAAVDYIGERNPDAGLRFLAAAEDAFERLAAMPGMGGLWESPNPRLAGLRVWPIRGFENYLIFYRPLPDGIAVARVIHGSRDIERILGGGR